MLLGLVGVAPGQVAWQGKGCSLTAWLACCACGFPTEPPSLCPTLPAPVGAVTYLAPSPGPLPGKYLLAGSYKTYMD